MHDEFLPGWPYTAEKKIAASVNAAISDHRQTSRNRGLFLIIQKEKKVQMSNI